MKKRKNAHAVATEDMMDAPKKFRHTVVMKPRRCKVCWTQIVCTAQRMKEHVAEYHPKRAN